MRNQAYCSLHRGPSSTKKTPLLGIVSRMSKVVRGPLRGVVRRHPTALIQNQPVWQRVRAGLGQRRRKAVGNVRHERQVLSDHPRCTQYQQHHHPPTQPFHVFTLRKSRHRHLNPKRCIGEANKKGELVNRSPSSSFAICAYECSVSVSRCILRPNWSVSPMPHSATMPKA
jgi:hypothetical protein